MFSRLMKQFDKKPNKKQTRRHRKRLSVLSESVLSEDVSVAHDDDRDDGVSVSAKSGQPQVVKNNLVQKAKQLKEKLANHNWMAA